MSDLSRDLGALVSRRAAAPSASGAGLDSAARVVVGHAISEEDPARPTASLLDLPGAHIREIGGVPCFAVKRDVTELYAEADVAQEIAKGMGGVPLEDLVVFDIETAGLWSCPVFVSAFLLVEEGRLVTLQFVTRDYAEEAAVLRATCEALASRRVLVTFNGKSFDLPFVADRATYHRVPFELGDLVHIDLLHAARRLYRGYFPDCRLQTLERMLLGIRRVGDIPSAEIPAVFHHFVATGDIERVKDVLHHSRIDVLSTGLLLGKLSEAEVDPASSSRREP